LQGSSLLAFGKSSAWQDLAGSSTLRFSSISSPAPVRDPPKIREEPVWRGQLSRKPLGDYDQASHELGAHVVSVRDSLLDLTVG